MEKLKHAWGWIAAGAILVIGILIAIFLPDRRTVAVTVAKAAEKTILPKIAVHQKNLDELKKDATKNAAKIVVAQQDLAQEKEKLNAQYTRQGLSADEIAARFRRVRL